MSASATTTRWTRKQLAGHGRADTAGTAGDQDRARGRHPLAQRDRANPRVRILAVDLLGPVSREPGRSTSLLTVRSLQARGYHSAVLVIVDVGLGNVASVRNMLDRLGHAAELRSSPSGLDANDRYILPGIGSYDEGVQRLRDFGWFDHLQ